MLHSDAYSDGVLAYNKPGVTVVLVNLCLWGELMANSGFRGWRDDSCACRETASRVVLTGIRAWSSYVR
jgi:hypothetical protein